MATLLDKVSSISKPQVGTVAWLKTCIERGRTSVFSEAVTLSPGLAAVLLHANAGNRNIRPMKVEQYASDIRAGRWAFNGEPIIVSDTGELNDGQHRCEAVVSANMSVPALLVFGIKRATRLTVDQGAARGAGDYLAMEGVPNASNAATIARLLIAYELSGGQNINQANRVTNAEVRARVNSDPLVVEAASIGMGHYKSCRHIMPASVVGLCHYLFTEISPEDAGDYLTQVCGGEGLRKNDPAYTVRDRMIGLGRNRDYKIEIILRGWNAYRQGRKLSIAKVLGSLPALI